MAISTPNEPLSVSRIDDLNTLSLDETGQYEFTGLAPGNYSVGIVVAPQREQTFPINSNRLSVSVEAGETGFNNNFGLVSIDTEQPPVNHNPIITGFTLDSIEVGQTLVHSIIATDSDS